MFSKSAVRTKEIRAKSILRCFSTASTLQPPSTPHRPTRVLNENSEKVLKDALRRITRVDNFIPITRLDVITALLNKEKFLSHHEQKKLSQLVGGMHQSLMQKMHGIHEKMKEKSVTFLKQYVLINTIYSPLCLIGSHRSEDFCPD